MIKKIIKRLTSRMYFQRINIALSRVGYLTRDCKMYEDAEGVVDLNKYECSVFSQNGEDGIINFLVESIKNPNKYFIEIGASKGIENNTAFLAFIKKFSGIMIEGNKFASFKCKAIMESFNIGVEAVNLFVNAENIQVLEDMMVYKNPDVFSIDIDGNDYFLTKIILASKLKPKIFIVEYNATFGIEKSITIKYNENFDFTKAHESHLYYGVSISAWKKLFKEYGYRFIGVDSNGVNAFFIDEAEFEEQFALKIKMLDYQENFYEMTKFKLRNEERFNLIKDMDFTII